MLNFFRNRDAESVYYLGLKPDNGFYNELKQVRLALTPLVGENHLTIAYSQSIPLIGFPIVIREERKLKQLFKKEFSKLSSDSKVGVGSLFIDELTGSFGFELKYDDKLSAFVNEIQSILKEEFELPKAQIMARNSKRLVLVKNLPKLLLEKVANESILRQTEFKVEGITLKRQTNTTKFKVVEQLSWV